jgi:hypothetical protein
MILSVKDMVSILFLCRLDLRLLGVRGLTTHSRQSLFADFAFLAGKRKPGLPLDISQGIKRGQEALTARFSDWAFSAIYHRLVAVSESIA